MPNTNNQNAQSAGSTAVSNVQSAGNNAAPNIQGTGNTTASGASGTQERTFTQAEVDAMITRRLERERKKYPTDDEMDAFRTWRESQQTGQERLDSLMEERDSARADLSNTQAELQQAKRELYVLSKGITGEEAEFIAFKAAKMVDDKTTFEEAVDSLITNQNVSQNKVAFDWTASVGSGQSAKNGNSVMNDLIRGALR